MNYTPVPFPFSRARSLKPIKKAPGIISWRGLGCTVGWMRLDGNPWMIIIVMERPWFCCQKLYSNTKRVKLFAFHSHETIATVHWLLYRNDRYIPWFKKHPRNLHCAQGFAQVARDKSSKSTEYRSTLCLKGQDDGEPWDTYSIYIPCAALKAKMRNTIFALHGGVWRCRRALLPHSFREHSLVKPAFFSGRPFEQPSSPVIEGERGNVVSARAKQSGKIRF